MRSGKDLNVTALVLAPYCDHGDGDADAWHVWGEFLVLRNGGERKVDDGVALGLVGIRSGRAGKIDVNNVSNRAIEDELINYEVREQHYTERYTRAIYLSIYLCIYPSIHPFIHPHTYIYSWIAFPGNARE